MSRSDNELKPADLEKIITTLQFVYEICLQKRSLYEKINHDCQDVLKPWPIKKGHGQSEQEKESGKQAEVTPVQQKELPPEEKLGLTLVEKALAKAERTRNKFKYKEQDHVATAEKERPRSLRPSTNSSKVVPSKQKDRALLSSSSRDNLPYNQHKDASSVKTCVSNSISQTHLNSVLHSTRSGALTATRPGLAKTRFTPAHVRAPFKTQQEVKVRRSVIQVKSADKSNQRDNVSEMKNDPSVSTKPHSLVSGRTSVINKDSQHCVIYSDVDYLNNAAQTSHNPQAMEKVDCRSRDVQPGTKSGPVLERFCLLKQGKQLSMPSRYKRLLTQNQKLQEKMSSLYMSSSVPPCVSLDVFMKRLQQSIDDEKSSEAIELRKILSLTNVYYTLHRLILQVPLNIVMSYDLDWREVLVYIHKLELVLNSVALLESYYEKLIDLPKPVKPYDPDSLSKPKLPGSTLWWIPEHIGSVSGPIHRHCLTYTTPKQLIQYSSLLHQIQVLLLEKHVLQEMEVILEKFNQATGKESWFVPVYRALYGILCSSGRSFPTVVTDTIDSSDGDEEDD